VSDATFGDSQLVAAIKAVVASQKITDDEADEGSTVVLLK